MTAVSHKVIRNLLDAVLEQKRGSTRWTAQVRARCLEVGPAQLSRRGSLRTTEILLGQKCDVATTLMRIVHEEIGQRRAFAALASGEIHVLGGTSWLWSRDEASETVDVLFVDEAGQMSLANALAVSGAAQSLVLLGDPQQLEQPQKGTHPDGVGVSALEHVLGGAATMPPDRGLFLPTTWRLHPAICAFTSEVFYEGKLEREARPRAPAPHGYGRRSTAPACGGCPSTHDGNQNSSMEEVDAVERHRGPLLGLARQVWARASALQTWCITRCVD